ncbi:MAG: TIGR04372 family glycosyltransferase [Vicinamibacterales bacterium]
MIFKSLPTGRGRLVVTIPNTEQYGHLALEILMSFLLAKEQGASRVRFLVPDQVVNPALLQLRTPGIDVIGPWHPLSLLTLPWQAQRGVLRVRVSLRKAIRRREMYGDTRFPEWFRDLVYWYDESTTEAIRRDTFKDDVPYYRRALMRRPIQVALPESTLAQARAEAARIGLDPDARIVTLHAREGGFKAGREMSGFRKDHTRNAHIENYFDLMDDLVRRGYTVVRVGDPSMTPVSRPGVIDLATSPLRTGLVDLFCLMKSVFMVGCESGPYGVVYLTDTPSLIVNCTDPISAFPIRANMLHVLKLVRDYKSGQILSLQDMLTERYLKHLRDVRRYEYIENSAEDLVEAGAEMVEFVERGLPETPLQSTYKARVVSTAEELRDRYSYVRKWGPEDGFMGDGRLGGAFLERYWETAPA